MSQRSPIVRGQLKQWPTRERMGEILRSGGLRATVGRYSVRVEDCSHFDFLEYGGDLGGPVIDADADSTAELLRDTRRVSEVLGQAGVVHRFEVYDERNELAGYFHHGWPRVDAA